MKKLIVAACSFSASVALLGGAVSAASISTTGPGSHNKIKVKNVNVCKVKNNNNVSVSNVVSQTAKTGSASVKHNTDGGDAMSGDADNTATNTVTGSLNNNVSCPEVVVAPTSGSIDTTGPGSHNSITSTTVSKVTVTNNNNVNVGNVVVQNAQSGNATVWGNTSGGSATTGGAGNSSTSVVTLTVNNN